MSEGTPKFTPEEKKLHSERGGYVSGQSRRGEIKRDESGKWKLTEKGEEALHEKALEEDAARGKAADEKPFIPGPAAESPEKTPEKPEAEESKELKIHPDLEYLAKEAGGIPLSEHFFKKEIEAMPEGERKSLGIGFGTIGFFIEEQKNKFFAKTFGAAEKGFKEKSTMRRFFSSLSEIFSRDAERARKNIDEVSQGKSKKLSNTGYLAGNLIKYGRTVADFVGWTAASPLRYVMISAMGFARGAEAAKEARLKNESVIEKTRVDDIDKATNEAWKVYEEAVAEAGGKRPTKEDLERAYSRGIPKDVLERLKSNPEAGVVSGIAHGIAKKYVEYSANGIERKLEKIEGNEKLSAEEKKNKRDNLFSRYQLRLQDLDRMVSKYGTVDGLAFGAKAVEKSAKAVVAVVMAESLYLAAQKLWENLPHLFASMEWSPSIPEQADVKKGDSVWKVIERQLSSSYGQKFLGLNESQKTYVLDALKDKIVADPEKYGLTDPDRLKIGQKIKIGELFRDRKELGSFFENAGGLNAGEMENIKNNNLILREWVRTHPGERLTSEKVNEILSRGGLIAETQPQRPFGHLPVEEQRTSVEGDYREESKPLISREVMEDIGRRFELKDWSLTCKPEVESQVSG